MMTASLFHRQILATHLTILLFFCWGFNSSAYTVSGLTATCKKGQVFLVWQNPSATNLQYNVYRSTVKFTSSSQLNSSTYLGFVRDSSSKNMQLTYKVVSNIFFRIDSGGIPLPGSKGLYVVTCTNNQPYYYMVTVTTLSNNIEDKLKVTGENTLSVPVSELVEAPQPVYQYSETWSTGEIIDRYVQFVSNQETPLYHAMVSTGSYGFNFYILKRGSATRYPLFVLYEGLLQNSLKGNGLGEFENMGITNCYILGVDDWLPIANGTYFGEGTNWCGYHENFNIYSNTNPVPTTGKVKLYTQQRIIQSIRWSKRRFPIDTSKVYTVGVSAGGNAAMLTANLIPNEIAAVYSIVQPISLNKVISLHYQMWGAPTSALSTDFFELGTTVPLKIYTVLNLNQLMSVNKDKNLPLFFDVHGKGDQTIIWNSNSIAWYDSLESDRMGGVFWWDQRDHPGNGANFLDVETTPKFTRYETTKSFPAFSHCSINQDPGDGSPTSGSSYGGLNNYIDWNDTIKDYSCNYMLSLFLKDLYAWGVLYPVQYATCTTSITLRRLQNFHPSVGSMITWKNFNAANAKIQSGSLIYDGKPITLANIIVNKEGNKIKLVISGCTQRPGEEEENESFDVTGKLQPLLNCYPNPSGGQFTIELESDSMPSTLAGIEVINSQGQTIFVSQVAVTDGTGRKVIDATHLLNNGMYLVKMIAGDQIFSSPLMIQK